LYRAWKNYIKKKVLNALHAIGYHTK